MRDRPRTPGLVYLALALALIILLAAFALTARQPPPPTIAEFAPQAVENITDAPSDQSSSVGRGAGSGPGGDGGLGARATVTPPPINVPRVRRCVGDPPRQIEDPQSPPCVPYWAGDNGGATSKGVTRDEVRVFAPHSNLSRNEDYVPEQWRLTQEFFNKRFEFYGRKLRLILDPGAGGATDEPAQRASAVAADEQHQVFATTMWPSAGGRYFHQELARRRIISATGVESLYEQRQLELFAPYMWQYPMAAEGVLANLGSWACARLAGSVASHGGADVLTSKRVFGVIVAPYFDYPSIAPFDTQLARCGEKSKLTIVDPPGNTRRDAGGGNETSNEQGRTNTMLQMRQAGVTTIVCLCNWIYGRLIQTSAGNQGYSPEWILSSFINNDNNAYLKAAGPPGQLDHSFGLTFRPRQVPPSGMPYLWALKEMDPNFSSSTLATRNSDLIHLAVNAEFYRSLLLIASGVQMAGPRLTPESFAGALHKTRFPNPEHPIRAGAVGFANGSFAMTTDAAEWWWSSTSTSPYPGDSVGSICYVDGGARRMSPNWPGGPDPLFQLPCDSGA